MNNTAGNQQVPNYNMNNAIGNQQVPNYNNFPNSSNNSKNNLIIIIIAVVVLAALVGLGMFLWKQYKLKQVDKELQEQVGNIGTIDPIGGNNNQNNNDKTTYKVGDAVALLDGSKWHVIGISGNNVTLLSDTLAKEKSGYGNDSSYESQKYENSIVKKYLEGTYLPSLKTSLQSKGGDVSNLKVRLITANEYLKLTGVEFAVSSDASVSECWFTKSQYYDLVNESYSDVPTYLALTNDYWTMDNYKDYASNKSSCNYNGYHGSYYVKVTKSSFDENSGRVELMMDDYALGSGTSYGTFIGIRPVIETTINNIR